MLMLSSQTAFCLLSFRYKQQSLPLATASQDCAGSSGSAQKAQGSGRGSGRCIEGDNDLQAALVILHVRIRPLTHYCCQDTLQKMTVAKPLYNERAM